MNAVVVYDVTACFCATYGRTPVHSTLLADMGFLLGEVARVQTNQHFIIWRDLGKVNKTCHSGHSAYTIIFYILKPNTKILVCPTSAHFILYLLHPVHTNSCIYCWHDLHVPLYIFSANCDNLCCDLSLSIHVQSY